MEAYLREDSRMSADWEAVNAYEAEEATPCVDAQRPENLMKNRLIAPLPCTSILTADRVTLINDICMSHMSRDLLSTYTILSFVKTSRSGPTWLLKFWFLIKNSNLNRQIGLLILRLDFLCA